MNPHDSHAPDPAAGISLPHVTVQSLTPTQTVGSISTPAPASSPGVSAMPSQQMVASLVQPAATQKVKTPNRFLDYWRKAGGGSLMLSLLIHAALLAAAFFVVQTIVTEQPVDFLPGGGSKSGQEADAMHDVQMKQKKQKSLAKSAPMQRIVSVGPGSISIPDVPLDTLDMPETSSLLGGGSMGSGGFGGSGFGGGLGSGIGPGSVKGFLARTVFGKLGDTEGLPGKFYDFKQDSKRKPLEYTPNMYGGLLAKAAERRYSEASLNDYYQAKQQVSFSFLTIPNMKAEEGPKAFQVDKEVEPRGWMVHYTGMITPPVSGDWRFMGLFDDVLFVYINNKLVLDGSYGAYSSFGGNKPDEDIRQEFGENFFGPRWPVRIGKWVKLDGTSKIDIVLGEVPGGSVGGGLFVQNKKTPYKQRANGTPILPVFTTTKLDMEDQASIKKFTASTKFEIEEETPVFTVKKSLLEEGSALDRMKAGSQ